jgi:hypothetical protein
MFLKDKYLASGAFDRFKARIVAGGNQQDRNLYDNLSEAFKPTAFRKSRCSLISLIETLVAFCTKALLLKTT